MLYCIQILFYYHVTLKCKFKISICLFVLNLFPSLSLTQIKLFLSRINFITFSCSLLFQTFFLSVRIIIEACCILLSKSSRLFHSIFFFHSQYLLWVLFDLRPRTLAKHRHLEFKIQTRRDGTIAKHRHLESINELYKC